MIGQLYGHVTLTMWKLTKKTPFPILKERTRGGKNVLTLLAYLHGFFVVFWHQSTLCKIINQAANIVNSDLPAFSSVQATSLWRVSYHRRTKEQKGSESPLCDTCIKIISKIYIKMASIIPVSKLHQNSMSKWLGKLSILTCQRNFDIDSTCLVCW